MIFLHFALFIFFTDLLYSFPFIHLLYLSPLSIFFIHFPLFIILFISSWWKQYDIFIEPNHLQMTPKLMLTLDIFTFTLVSPCSYLYVNVVLLFFVAVKKVYVEKTIHGSASHSFRQFSRCFEVSTKLNYYMCYFFNELTYFIPMKVEGFVNIFIHSSNTKHILSFS